MGELCGPAITHQEITPHEGELHHLRSGHAGHVDDVAEVVGVDVHHLVLVEQLGEHRRGDGEERILGELAEEVELDGHDPEAAQQRRRGGEQRGVLSALDVHLQQEIARAGTRLIDPGVE